MTEITVDFTRNVRAMKPVRAIGQPPILGWNNEFQALAPEQSPPPATLLTVR